MNFEDARHRQLNPLVLQAVPVEPLQEHHRPDAGFAQDPELALQRWRKKGSSTARIPAGPCTVTMGGGFV
jgi:hypothetical protein